MKVVHITPTYFTDSSVIGGGERYVTELSQWMSRRTDTTMVTFSSRRQSSLEGSLRVEVYPVRHLIHGNRVNPLSFRYLESVLGADIVHLHHVHTLVSDMACLLASMLGKPVFVTDYGGGGSFALNGKLPVFRAYRNAIVYSQFGVACLPEMLRSKAILIKGGIDTDRFRPDPTLATTQTILFVGRLLPHKGIDYLVRAFGDLKQPGYQLRIIGRVYDKSYYAYLRELAAGLPVEFVHDADDERLLREYRSARATVLPSVHTTYHGTYSSMPELMGFTLLESQACGTPVVCTDAGAMKEFVADGRTGFVVKQNSPESIANALRRLIDASPQVYSEYRANCRQWITPLNWSAVVNRHLELYESSIR